MSKYLPANKSHFNYIFYFILLAFFLKMQIHLKVLPQFFIFSLAAIMILNYHLKFVVIFRVAAFILLFIFGFCFIFQCIYFIWDFYEPNRGLVIINGKKRALMDVSGVFVVFFSFIITLVVSIVNLIHSKNKSIASIYHLAIGTVVCTLIVFIYTEIIQKS
jgi:hypothetical protein